MRRDHAKYLTLIDAIALLHQHQREVKTLQRRGETIEYIEVTLSDIALANELAHEVLGRSLDELPPQTRRVLEVIESLVKGEAQRRSLPRSEVRFTRRELRGNCGMSDTARRVHLERLVLLEYVRPALGRNGLKFELSTIIQFSPPVVIENSPPPKGTAPLRECMCAGQTRALALETSSLPIRLAIRHFPTHLKITYLQTPSRSPVRTGPNSTLHHLLTSLAYMLTAGLLRH